MSSSEYLKKTLERTRLEKLDQAIDEASDAFVDARDSGEDSQPLRDKAVANLVAKRREGLKRKKRGMALIKAHGKRAAKARSFGTNYNAKPYANPPRKPKANLK